ncbi:MAG: hypothetical protein LBT54_00145, partial [Bifidobacteriaceae bacterium]|nr:hypothetical protein [Bifidobacteriaceae bacterium]
MTPSLIPIPTWDFHGDPAGVVRFIDPGAVAALVNAGGPQGPTGLPGRDRGIRPGEGNQPAAIDQVRACYEALASLGIRYADEAESSAGLQPTGQAVRSPWEVLVTPKSANCLDLSLVFAGACLDIGLQPMVVISGSTDRVWHVFVLVRVSDSPGSRAEIASPRLVASPVPESDVRSEPDDFGEWVSVDVALLAQRFSPDASPGGATFDDAAASGRGYVTNPSRTWVSGIELPNASAPGYGEAFADSIPRVRSGGDGLTELGLVAPYLKPGRAESPLAAMTARAGLSPFVPWSEYGELWARLTAHDAPVGLTVTLLYGHGGTGKTRLAAELARRAAQERGWLAGFLSEPGDPHEAKSVERLQRLAATASPLLVVCDYPEASQIVNRLPEILGRRPLGTRTHLLLAARNAISDHGDQGAPLVLFAEIPWWRDFVKQLRPVNPRITDPILIPSRFQQTSTLFRNTAQRLRQLPPPRTDWQANPAPTWAVDPKWSALEVVLAAWIAVWGETRPEAPQRRELYDEVVEHELSYWNRLYMKRAGRETGGLSPEELRRIAAYIALAGPDEELAIDLLVDHVFGVPGHAGARTAVRGKAEAVLAALRPVLCQRDRYAIQPDPVAEHIILDVLTDQHDGGAWIRQGERPLVEAIAHQAAPQSANEGVPPASRPPEPSLMARSVCRAITRLGQTEQRQRSLEVAQDRAAPLASRVQALADCLLGPSHEAADLKDVPLLFGAFLEEALRNGGPCAKAIETVIQKRGPALPLPFLAALDDAIPFSHTALSQANLLAVQLIADRTGQAQALPVAEQAALLGRQSTALASVGQHGEALDVARRATEIYEGLATANP